MPGGKRTDAISKRDLEVLEFIARFGIAPRAAVATWAGTARTVTLTRERRLREAGLIEVRSGIWGESKLVACTRVGLAAAGRSDLRPAKFSLATARHEVRVAELAASLEAKGERMLSEREMMALERAEGERIFSAALSGGKAHRADLIRTMGVGPPQAIEVELVAKGAARLDELLRGWRRASVEGRLSGVMYWCAPGISRVVRKAVERTRTESVVKVEEL
jgi:hypothetical protein